MVTSRLSAVGTAVTTSFWVVRYARRLASCHGLSIVIVGIAAVTRTPFQCASHSSYSRNG